MDCNKASIPTTRAQLLHPNPNRPRSLRPTNQPASRANGCPSCRASCRDTNCHNCDR